MAINEGNIILWTEVLDDLRRTAGAAEQTRIVPNLIVIDATPAGLTGYIIVRSEQGVYSPVLKLPGFAYAVNDYVNVLYMKGTEPVAISQGAASPSTAVKVSEIWESDFGARTGAADATGNFVWNGWQAADANGSIILNTSGATVAAGACGYIDNSREFKTTTTALFETPQPVYVLQGGANNADIYVTPGPARLTVAYTGTAPAAGQYVAFSTVAGSVAAQATMHPAVIGRARALGAGGVIEIDTLCLTIPGTTVDSANNVYATTAATTEKSLFAGTIATLPGGAVLTYTPVSGDETALVPLATTNIGKMVLHNTTRGTSALISNSVAATNTITLTATVPVGWATTDVITISSQTNTATIGGAAWVDIELGSEIPTLTRTITLFLSWTSDTTNRRAGIHPFEADVTSKRKLERTQNLTQVWAAPLPKVQVKQNRICVLWEVTGTVGNFILTLAGYDVAG